MTQGVHVFLSSQFMELRWLKQSMYWRNTSTSLIVEIVQDIDFEAALTEAFLQAVTKLRLPAGTPVFWILPPDIVGLLCDKASPAEELPLTPVLPFSDDDVRQFGIHRSPGFGVIAWVHSAWIAFFESLTVKAGLLPVLMFGRAQIVGPESARTSPASGLTVVLESQGRCGFLHAFQAEGFPIRSIELPLLADKDKTALAVNSELAALTELLGINVSDVVVLAQQDTEPGWQKPHGVKKFSSGVVRTSDRRLSLAQQFEFPGISMGGKPAFQRAGWLRYMRVLAALLVVALVFLALVPMWQDFRTKELDNRLKSLKGDIQAVQMLQKRDRELAEPIQVLRGLQQGQDALARLAAVVEVLPKTAYITRAEISTDRIELDVVGEPNVGLDTLKSSLPTFVDASRNDLPGGATRFLLSQSPTVVPSDASKQKEVP